MFFPRIDRVFLAPLLFAFFAHSTILLKVEGDAILDVYKPVLWTRATTDPETFILVNVVLDKDATHGTQALLRTNGSTSGISQVVAHFPGTHHVFAYLNATSVTANATPLATSNNFGILPAPRSSMSSSTTSVTTESSVPATIATVTPNSSTTASPHANTPALAGGIAGAVVAVILIIIAIWYLLRRRRKATAAIDNSTEAHPFALQLLPDHVPYQVALLRTEKSGIRQPTRMTETQNVLDSTSYRQLASSSKSQNESTPTLNITTEIGHHRVLVPLPGGVLSEPPASETNRMAIKLDEAVAEIVNLRGELRSLGQSAWTSRPASEISPPSYDFNHVH